MKRQKVSKKSMEKIGKEIEILKEKIKKRGQRVKDPKKDLILRRMRKGLKRAQRKLARLTPLSIKEQVERTQRLMEMINKRIDILTKKGKRSDDPYVHSLRKRLKSLNKQLKRQNKSLEEESTGSGHQPSSGEPK
jgi:capsule polysaccharide export protein KpsE/RkpR